jgi:periplasmic protein CpxP/Spy
MTKHTLMTLTALAGTLALQPLAHATNTNDPASAAISERLAAGRERMQETAHELNLAPEQIARLQAIVRDRMEKVRELRQDTSLSPEEKQEKLGAARQEVIAEVKKVLTPEQFEKWKAKQGPIARASGGPLARVQETIKELNLTATQKEQLKPIYEEQMGKLLELQQDNGLSMAEKLEKLNSLRLGVGPQLKKVLDAEQYAKWEKGINLWMEQLKQRLQAVKPK